MDADVPWCAIEHQGTIFSEQASLACFTTNEFSAAGPLLLGWTSFQACSTTDEISAGGE